MRLRAIISRITSFSAARPIGMAMPISRKRALQPVQMRRLVDRHAAQHIGDFIDAVAQLQAAILDMHRRPGHAADSGH